jgi:hypothetical protein
VRSDERERAELCGFVLDVIAKIVCRWKGCPAEQLIAWPKLLEVRARQRPISSSASSSSSFSTVKTALGRGGGGQLMCGAVMARRRCCNRAPSATATMVVGAPTARTRHSCRRRWVGAGGPRVGPPCCWCLTGPPCNVQEVDADAVLQARWLALAPYLAERWASGDASPEWTGLLGPSCDSSLRLSVCQILQYAAASLSLSLPPPPLWACVGGCERGTLYGAGVVSSPHLLAISGQPPTAKHKVVISGRGCLLGGGWL